MSTSTSTSRVTPGPPRGLMVTELISSPSPSLRRSVRVEIVIEHAVKARLRHDEIADVRQAGGVVADFTAVRGPGDERQPQDQHEGGQCGALHGCSSLFDGGSTTVFAPCTQESFQDIVGHYGSTSGPCSPCWCLKTRAALISGQRPRIPVMMSTPRPLAREHEAQRLRPSLHW